MSARLTGLSLALIVAAGAWACWPGLQGVFVFDDLAALERNPHIRSLWPPSSSMSAPADTTLAGRPVASLTFALNYALAPSGVRDVFGTGGAALPGASDRLARNARGYHIVNLTIHLFAALTLFGVVRRTASQAQGPRPKAQDARPKAQGAAPAARRWPKAKGDDELQRATVIATAISLLWVVHPLTTSAVTYVVQRVESLMALFYLLTLYCSIRAMTGNQAEGPRLASAEATAKPEAPKGERVWVLAAIVTCALGMATKENMVTAPLAVALWWLVFRSTRIGSDQPKRAVESQSPSWALGLRPWAWLFVGLCATWLILAVLVTGAPRSQSVGWTIAGWTPWTYLLTQSTVILHYLRLVFVPMPLILDYGWPATASFAPVVVPMLLLTAAFIAAAVAAWRRHAAGFPALMFFLLLAPTSSVLPIGSEVAAEHRMYLPLAAVITLVVCGGVSISRRVGARTAALVGGVLVIAATVSLAAMTRDRNRDYRSQEALWRHDIAHQPTHARARHSYGVALFAAGRYPEAEHQLREVVRLDPRDAQAAANLGAVLCAASKFDDCIKESERALTLEANQPDALATIGDAYTARGDDARAEPYLMRALAARPDDAMRLNRLGWVLATSADDRVRDGGRALTLAEHVVQLTRRRDVMSLNTLAAALAEVGRFDDAAAVTTEAIDLASQQGLASVTKELERRRALFAAGRTLRAAAGK